MRRLTKTASLAVAAFVVLASAQARAGDEIRERVEWAADVYRDLATAPDAVVPRWLLGQAKCIAIVPHVVKAAFIVGGRYGRGVITCRNAHGEWSPPVFIKLVGPSLGFQWGAQATDLVLFFRKERGVRSLLESRLALSGDAGVAAGPIGRRAEAGVDAQLKADILSYARTKGAFLGVSLEGTYLSVDREANRRYYGETVDPEAVLFRHEVDLVPSSARLLLDELP